MKILMVCLGNICRSPLAQEILQSKLSAKYSVDSAGTAAYHIGKKPDSRSISVAKKYDLDISNQRARQFIQEDFTEFDVIYAMDSSNFDNILSLAKNEEERKKVKLILEEIPNNKSKNVPDPYYGNEVDFEQVFQLLDKACTQISQNI
jgi:protein-tyrosine phosphatase